MKIAIRFVQILVGVLFIISGLVKANDPLGLSYKMQEFFEVWTLDLRGGHFFARGLLIQVFDALHNHSLFLSLVMITLEILAGVALLVGWSRRFILYLLLALIVFFTFLTGYAYLSTHPDGSPKFTNCGCFGDCLPITPGTSFTKDIVLLVLIVFLLVGQEWVKKSFSAAVRNGILVVALLASLFLQGYALRYLPPVDCLPFKKGNSLPQQMKPPPGSRPDSIAMRFVYEKDGKRFEFTPEQLPADIENYTFIDRVDKLIRKGNAEPAIKGFSLTDSTGTDHTAELMNAPTALLFFAFDPENLASFNDWNRLAALSASQNIPVALATSNAEAFRKFFASKGIHVPVYACDFTIIRTAARTDPTLYRLEKGIVRGKYGKPHLNQGLAPFFEK